MKLDLFKHLNNVDEEKLHNKFKILRDEFMVKGEKEILTDWTEGFVDRDGKIINEFQTTFHSSFWEFYLHSVLKNNGFLMNQNHDRPDFMVTGPVEFNLEAVVANIKDGGVPENKRTFEDIMSMVVPPRLQSDFTNCLDEAITRCSKAMQRKNKYYKINYSKCNWIQSNTPFVIALSSYDQINYGREFIYPMMALLYGWYYRPETEGYYKRGFIVKPGSDAKLKIGLFNKKEYENVSAVMFSCTMTLGKLTSRSIVENKLPYNYNHVFTIRHDIEDNEIPYKLQIVSKETPEYLDDGLFIFHNPNAKNKLNLETFKNTNIIQIYMKENKMHTIGENLPIISRINIPKLFLPEQYVNQFVIETMSKYNNLIY